VKIDFKTLREADVTYVVNFMYIHVRVDEHAKLKKSLVIIADNVFSSEEDRKFYRVSIRRHIFTSGETKSKNVTS